MNSQTSTRSRGHIREIRNQQRKIKQVIDTWEKNLPILIRNPNQPLATTPIVRRIPISKLAEYLAKSPSTSLGLVLRDLGILKQQHAALGRQERSLAVSQQAGDLRQRLERTLREAEQRGYVDEAEMDRLQQAALQVLGLMVGQVNGNPSLENIAKLLADLETALLVGNAATEGACVEALKTLARATGGLRDRARQKFRKFPSVENFRDYLNKEALNQHLGGAQNGASIDCVARKPGAIHQVVRGDSLSKIARGHYGSAGCWDKIYLENHRAIGDDPNKLRVGMQLVVP